MCVSSVIIKLEMDKGRLFGKNSNAHVIPMSARISSFHSLKKHLQESGYSHQYALGASFIRSLQHPNIIEEMAELVYSSRTANNFSRDGKFFNIGFDDENSNSFVKDYHVDDHKFFIESDANADDFDIEDDGKHDKHGKDDYSDDNSSMWSSMKISQTHQSCTLP
jgi:hypothetical protein